MMILILIPVIGLPATGGWVLGVIGMTVSGGGTRARWVSSTLERGCRWPMLVFRCASFALYARTGEWGSFGLTLLSLAGALWFITQRTGNDDDFWTGRGTRLKRRLRDAVSRLRPAPALAPARY